MHTIPTKDGWTIIFNKVNNEWGSFNYDAKQDALRVTAKPKTGDFQETMTIDFENVNDNTAQVVIAWEKLRVPFTIDVGDVNKRVLSDFRRQMKILKSDNSARRSSGELYSQFKNDRKL